MPDHKIMTGVDTTDMAQLAMIEAVRALSDNVKIMREGIAELRDEAKEDRAVLTQVKEGQIRMEANLMTDEVKELKSKVAVLETTLSEQRGAFKLGTVVKDFAPLIYAIAAAFAVYVLKTSP